ncbi:MAG: hypothetical protein H6752_10295 [Candidatus Omnitrophica bacterium]|nr:hypothetical protein [Candidatus Omnitrophota bacterium]
MMTKTQRKPFRLSRWLSTSLAVSLTATLCVHSSYGQTSTLTYENWAQGFFTHNCLGCHHSSLKGDERFGAPADINFETLDQIKQWAFEISDQATGDDPKMPPTGVVWWWDRVSLQEWLQAGMPGEADSLHSVELHAKENSLSYKEERFHFSGPLEDYPNIREIEFGHWWEEHYEGLRTWRNVYVHLNADGSVSIAGREWETRNDDWSIQRYRRIEYDPYIPLLNVDPENFGQTWQQTVSVRERRWNGWTGGNPVYDQTTQETWRSTNAGLEQIDNGVIRPPTTLKMVLNNLTADVTETYWFEKGMGIMRREIDAPSDTYIREVTREMNIVTREYPLYGPFMVESASEEYLPLYSRWWDGEGDNWGYDYDFEIQKVAIVENENGSVPTPTNTLAPDPTDTYVHEDPTATPFPSGLPQQKPTFTPTQAGPGATATATPTGTPTDMEVGPTATNTLGSEPTSTVDSSSPASYDHNGDRRVDMKDLLMFLAHWQEEMEN